MVCTFIKRPSALYNNIIVVTSLRQYTTASGLQVSLMYRTHSLTIIYISNKQLHVGKSCVVKLAQCSYLTAGRSDLYSRGEVVSGKFVRIVRLHNDEERESKTRR